MGQTLSEPNTEKATSSFDNHLFLVGVSSMQGWRTEMEDAHCVQLPLSEDSDSAYFGVFDGHGGPRFAAYCSENLHKCFLSDISFSEGNYSCALKCSFLKLDRNLQDDISLGFQYEPGGTTAVVVLVKDKQIFCANSGDSRAIASVRGEVQELSHDHKPIHPAEESRIYKAGGWIEFQRVNGNLSLSRAIGDFNFKSNQDLPQEDQIITADPEIVLEDITPEHEFIVLACDGVWDVMSNQEVVDFVRRRIADNIKPQVSTWPGTKGKPKVPTKREFERLECLEDASASAFASNEETKRGPRKKEDWICEALLDHCLAPDCRMGGLGCDNMTAIIACCLHGGSYSELARKCSEPVMERKWSHSKGDVSTSGKRLPNGDISEERTSGGSYLHRGALPGFKLNDTLRGANTDIDSEISDPDMTGNVGVAQCTGGVFYDLQDMNDPALARIETTV